jgi:3-oxoacyl-(acyl-carrier-protein) synthase/SAM-dependent methyltransferase/NAD(P)-dependent dehydrogenase (short-subunit alcohol dehydrogenase family)/acyl carrier protein
MTDIADRLAALSPEQRALLVARLAGAPSRPPAPQVAIIGIGCRFPGGAISPEAFWDGLISGFDAVRDMPSGRWDATFRVASDAEPSGTSNRRRGGFLDDIETFDASFFGLSPREASQMDPQQRLLLETAWEALEDAGQVAAHLAGSATGVFIGVQSHSNDYYTLQSHRVDRIDTYTALGTAHSILANRLSFLLDLRGPSLAIDTACSSSLVAVHMACQSLKTGDCDLAVAGGVNLILTPDFSICLDKMEILAPDGRCKTFDERANGFVRGEGCGVIVLKRLEDAVRDGDPILAVIRGSAVNQDGASNGLTAPNGLAQEAVIRKALNIAQLGPEAVSYVETHGTGTALGDPIEIEALANVLRSGPEPRGRCVLGALKTNIGHLEAASGIAGLIKAVLCLNHDAIPANLHLSALNPHLVERAGCFVLPGEATPWPRGDKPRVAGVSSFGFGGTNAHVLLADAPLPPAALPPATGRGAMLLPISARSEDALRCLAQAHVAFLAGSKVGALEPTDIAYTASLRRLHHDQRLCAVGTTAAEWAASLRRQLGEIGAASPVPRDGAPAIVFAFSGTDGAWPGAGAQLLRGEPAFREMVEQCDAALRRYASWSLIDEIAASGAASRHARPDIDETCLFAVQAGLVALWRSWGVQPARLLGHGVGEIAAAYAGGALTLEDAISVVVHRGTNREPARLVAAVRALLSDGCETFVAIGPHAFLKSAIEMCQTPENDCPTVVASLERDHDERHSMLKAAAALHVRGVSLDWARLSPAKGRCVQLPRYPWQRRRYWLPQDQSAQSPPVSGSFTRRPVEEAPADWFYQLTWRPLGPLGTKRDMASVMSGVDLRATESNLRASFRVPGDADVEAALRSVLDDVGIDLIWSALGELGAGRRVGASWPKAELRSMLRIVPRYERLVRRMADLLVGAGILRDEQQSWIVAAPPPIQAPVDRLSVFAAASSLAALLARCGASLAGVLRGDTEPLSLLFADDGAISAEAIYRDSPPSRRGNETVAAAVESWLAGVPADRTLRVLEIGAGTGGTTEALLPLLQGRNCDYVFTDVSPAFLTRAAKRFSDIGIMRFKLLDLERPPSYQGFQDHRFDLVIAANVLHATQDLGGSLAHVSELLADGGVLVLLECTTARPWMDITFGLTDGWWRFNDRQLRQMHPLLGQDAWVELLGKQGFADVAALPLQGAGGDAMFDQSIILARNPARAPGHIFVIDDASGLGEALIEELNRRGEDCLLVSDAHDIASDQRAKAVIHLATTPDLDLVSACQRPLGVIQALLSQRIVPELGLWLVTQGAQPPGAMATARVSQSLVWGLGRGAALEASELRPTLIDLDPEASASEAARALLDEIEHRGTEDQIILRGAERFAIRLERLDLAERGLHPLRLAGRHLITGGLGGIGSALALELARAGANELVLVVRRPLPDRASWHTLPPGSETYHRVDTVRRLEATGVKLFVEAVDLADERSLAALFRSPAITGAPLRGVWHGAMSFGTAAIPELGPGAVSSMIKVKAQAALRLHELTQDQPLDHFVLFSSTTALWGASGLAHYAAANAYLDALAHIRQSQGRPATVINWGVWDTARHLSPAQREQAEQVGLRPMHGTAAFAALARVLASGAAQTIVADVDWSRFKPAYEARRARPMLGDLGLPPATPPRHRGRDDREELVERLKSVASEPRGEILRTLVRREVAAVLGIDSETFLDPRKGFFDFGMDSLTSVQLRHRLENALMRPLASTLAFKYPTIEALAAYLEAVFEPAHEPDSGASTGTPELFAARSATLLGFEPVSDEADATEDELFDQLAARLSEAQA